VIRAMGGRVLVMLTDKPCPPRGPRLGLDQDRSLTPHLSRALELIGARITRDAHVLALCGSISPITKVFGVSGTARGQSHHERMSRW
jgi:hypothetical protein